MRNRNRRRNPFQYLQQFPSKHKNLHKKKKGPIRTFLDRISLSKTWITGLQMYKKKYFKKKITKKHEKKLRNLENKYIIDYGDNNWYIGGMLSKDKEREGLYHFRSGLVYIGYFEEDFKIDGIVVNPTIHLVVYKGEWKNNDYDGKGRLTRRDGRYYDGMFKNGKFHGKGTMFYTMHKKIEERAKKEKEKTNLTKNSKIDSKFNFNTITNLFAKKKVEYKKPEDKPINLIKYVGMFKNGKRHGFGKLEFKNGDIYAGEFKDNVFNGKGYYKWKVNNIEYHGEFENGEIKQKNNEDIFKYDIGISRITQKKKIIEDDELDEKFKKDFKLNKDEFEYVLNQKIPADYDSKFYKRDPSPPKNYSNNYEKIIESKKEFEIETENYSNNFEKIIESENEVKVEPKNYINTNYS